MHISRSASCANSPKAQKAEEISLALLGAHDLPDEVLADSATWQNGDNVLVGRPAIRASIRGADVLSIKVDEVVSHGKAAAVSGLFKTTKGAFLFCHMIKFTSASAKQVASIVSFEHPVKDAT